MLFVYEDSLSMKIDRGVGRYSFLRQYTQLEVAAVCVIRRGGICLEYYQCSCFFTLHFSIYTLPSIHSDEI